MQTLREVTGCDTGTVRDGRIRFRRRVQMFAADVADHANDLRLLLRHLGDQHASDQVLTGEVAARDVSLMMATWARACCRARRSHGRHAAGSDTKMTTRCDAPIANRAAVSRRLPEKRASSRLATFAQAMSSTHATAPKSSRSDVVPYGISGARPHRRRRVVPWRRARQRRERPEQSASTGGRHEGVVPDTSSGTISTPRS